MLNDELLLELKDRLQITWEDEATDRELTRLLVRGQSYFNELCGIKCEFKPESPERELLMERCRYSWNNALDDFEHNFLKELSRLIMMSAVEAEVVDDGSGTNT
jgi:hypothetical protein